jgi:hypothetical protein
MGKIFKDLREFMKISLIALVAFVAFPLIPAGTRRRKEADHSVEQFENALRTCGRQAMCVPSQDQQGSNGLFVNLIYMMYNIFCILFLFIQINRFFYMMKVKF